MPSGSEPSRRVGAPVGRGQGRRPGRRHEPPWSRRRRCGTCTRAWYDGVADHRRRRHARPRRIAAITSSTRRGVGGRRRRAAGREQAAMLRVPHDDARAPPGRGTEYAAARPSNSRRSGCAAAHSYERFRSPSAPRDAASANYSCATASRASLHARPASIALRQPQASS